MSLDNYRGNILGLAVGDALGAPIEFKRPGSFEPVTDMTCLMGIYRKKAVYRSVRVLGANLRDKKRSYLLVRIPVPPQWPTLSLYRASDGSTIFVLMASLLLTSYRFTFANSPFMDKVPSS